jgi:hypothetical protein
MIVWLIIQLSASKTLLIFKSLIAFKNVSHNEITHKSEQHCRIERAEDEVLLPKIHLLDA